jgi:transcriptional regulator with XRE-family HTH domain
MIFFRVAAFQQFVRVRAKRVGDLAERAGLSARYVSSIERGVVAASVTVLGRVARALDVDPAELIRGRR